MQLVLVLTLIIDALVCPPSSDTFARVLGQEKVSNIVSEVLALKSGELSKTFIVTDEALDRLATRKVPASVRRPLSELKSKEYDGDENFSGALRKTIGEDQTRRYQNTIMEYTKGSLETTADFKVSVNRIVLETETPESEDAAEALRQKFKVFLTSIISFDKGQTVAKNRIVLTGDLLDRYRAESTHCGEIPCARCCGSKCRSCKKK